MKDKSTKGTVAFLLECIVDGLIAMIWYKGLLFRCLPDMTYTESKRILWAMLAASIIMGTFVFFRYRKTGGMVFTSLVLPYGLYTMLTYTKTAGKIIKITLIAAAVASALCTIFLMKRKIRQGKNRKQVKKNRRYQCFCMTQSFVAMSMAVVMFSLGFRGIFGTTILNSAVQATEGNKGNKNTIDNNINTILLLQEDKWEELTTQERLDVMQVVANIEAQNLGIPNELNTGAANLNEHTLGSYSDATHTIYFNLKHLENGSAKEVLETCCHEAYHCYEERFVAAYKEADSDLKSLRIYKKAAVYEKEFSDYTKGEDDFKNYYEQECESDSREYAKLAVEEYYSKIKSTIKTQLNPR